MSDESTNLTFKLHDPKVGEVVAFAESLSEGPMAAFEIMLSAVAVTAVWHGVSPSDAQHILGACMAQAQEMLTAYNEAKEEAENASTDL
jgi:hypothetical protein